MMALTCVHPQILSLSLSRFGSGSSTTVNAAVSSSSISPRALTSRRWSLQSDQTAGRLAIASTVDSSRSACKLSSIGRLNPTTCSAVSSGDGNSPPSSSSTIQTRGQSQVSLKFGELYRHLLPFMQLTRMKNPVWHVFGFVNVPFYWGVALAAQNGSGPDLRLLALLNVASTILDMGACTVNDLCDKDFDGKVERTKRRPLVTGAVTPLQAWTLWGALVLLYVVVLSQVEAFRFGSQGQVLVAIQLFLCSTYPLVKRWTHWTPVYLALAINWGAIVGWAAVRGTGDLILSWPVLVPLFFAASCWTIAYETVYAHRDIKDDAKAGVKSLALLFGPQSKLWLTGFTTLTFASLSIAGHNAALGWPFYTGLAAAAAHMASQIYYVDIENPADCIAKFLSMRWAGALIFGGIVCGKLLA